jgi:hypothetical protein
VSKIDWRRFSSAVDSDKRIEWLGGADATSPVRKELFVAATPNPRHQPPGRIVPRWFWLTASSAALLGVGLLGFWLGQGRTPERQASLPVLTVAHDYTTSNQLGDNQPLPGAHGSVQVVTFVFRHCATRCPATVHGEATRALAVWSRAGYGIAHGAVLEIVGWRVGIGKVHAHDDAVASPQPLTAVRAPVKLPG